jgi:hypothetical protein
MLHFWRSIVQKETRNLTDFWLKETTDWQLRMVKKLASLK